MNIGLLIGIVCGLIISGLGLWLILLKYKENEQPTDDTVFLNFIFQYTQGYADGSVIEIINGSKRTGVKFLPRDLDYVKAFKNNDKLTNIKSQLVWIENNKLIHLPKGALSARRHKLWGLPPKPEDLNKEIKKTLFGEVLMEIIEKMNATTEESEILRKRINTQNKLLNKTLGLEIVEDFSNKVMEINKDISKLTSVKDNRGGMIPPYNSSGGS